MTNVNFSWFNAVIAVGLNIFFVVKFHQAVTEPSVFKNTDFYNAYELKFILLLLGIFFFYLAATYGIAKRKNRGFWYRYIGVFGPVGLVIAALLKKLEHEPVLTEEEEAEEEEEEEEEEQEENMEVKTIKVRTRDGRILNLKTLGEMPEDVKKEGAEVISEGDQNSNNSDSEETEENESNSNDGQSQNTNTPQTDKSDSQKNSNDTNYNS